MRFFILGVQHEAAPGLGLLFRHQGSDATAAEADQRAAPGDATGEGASEMIDARIIHGRLTVCRMSDSERLVEERSRRLRERFSPRKAVTQFVRGTAAMPIPPDDPPDNAHGTVAFHRRPVRRDAVDSDVQVSAFDERPQ